MRPVPLLLCTRPDFRAAAMRPIPHPLGTPPDFKAGITSPAPHPQSSVDAPRSLARHPAVPRSPGTNLTPGEA